MTNVIDILNAALDELRTTLIERDRTIDALRRDIARLNKTIVEHDRDRDTAIRELNERIGLQQSTIEQQYTAIELQSTTILSLRAQAGHLSKDHDEPTAPLDFQRLFQRLSERVLVLEHDVDVMKENKA